MDILEYLHFSFVIMTIKTLVGWCDFSKVDYKTIVTTLFDITSNNSLAPSPRSASTTTTTTSTRYPTLHANRRHLYQQYVPCCVSQSEHGLPILGEQGASTCEGRCYRPAWIEHMGVLAVHTLCDGRIMEYGWDRLVCWGITSILKV